MNACEVVIHVSDLTWLGMVWFLFKLFSAAGVAAIPFALLGAYMEVR